MTRVPEDPTVVSAGDDMFFSSKIQSVAGMVGVKVVQALDAEQLYQLLSGPAPRMIILDLNSKACAPLTAIRNIRADTRLKHVPVIGFLSHVQRELERLAQEAGCDQVMPRSAFSRNLPKILGGIR